MNKILFQYELQLARERARLERSNSVESRRSTISRRDSIARKLSNASSTVGRMLTNPRKDSTGSTGSVEAPKESIEEPVKKEQ